MTLCAATNTIPNDSKARRLIVVRYFFLFFVSFCSSRMFLWSVSSAKDDLTERERWPMNAIRKNISHRRPIICTGAQECRAKVLYLFVFLFVLSSRCRTFVPLLYRHVFTMQRAPQQHWVTSSFNTHTRSAAAWIAIIFLSRPFNNASYSFASCIVAHIFSLFFRAWKLTIKIYEL